jgi:hypothetical protein
MKGLKEYKDTLLPLVSAAALVMLTGCYEERPYYGGPPPPPPPPPVAVESYDYYYYPDQEVYFYPVTGVFFWYGGDGWHNGRRLPPNIVLHEQARVNVRLNTRVPYERHEEIRARYPAHGAPPHEERHEDQMEHGGH